MHVVKHALPIVVRGESALDTKAQVQEQLMASAVLDDGLRDDLVQRAALERKRKNCAQSLRHQAATPEIRSQVKRDLGAPVAQRDAVHTDLPNHWSTRFEHNTPTDPNTPLK